MEFNRCIRTAGGNRRGKTLPISEEPKTTPTPTARITITSADMAPNTEQRNRILSEHTKYSEVIAYPRREWKQNLKQECYPPLDGAFYLPVHRCRRV